MEDKITDLISIFQASTRILLSGSSKSGKSTWAVELCKAKDYIFTQPIVNIIWLFGA